MTRETLISDTNIQIEKCQHKRMKPRNDILPYCNSFSLFFHYYQWPNRCSFFISRGTPPHRAKNEYGGYCKLSTHVRKSVLVSEKTRNHENYLLSLRRVFFFILLANLNGLLNMVQMKTSVGISKSSRTIFLKVKITLVINIGLFERQCCYYAAMFPLDAFSIKLAQGLKTVVHSFSFFITT